MIKKYFTILLILLISLHVSAQVWVVPAENEGKKSPFAFSDSTRKAGADIYAANCKSCHGDPGKNNAIQLVPVPPDPASAKMQANSDGALHYKLLQGRGTMPSFKNTLTQTNLWHVISYVRGFNEKYVQEIAKTPSGSLTSLQNGLIVLEWLKESHQIQATVSGLKDKIVQPVSGAEVKLFAQRYFGNLLIDEARNTDARGIATFNFPTDLPGDSAGVVKLIVRLSNEEAYGEVKAESTMSIGVPTYRAPLNEPRAMWNVLAKTPIWLLLAYTLTVLTAWAFIVYVIVQIRAISKAGRSN
jgi:cytochrome c5